MRSGARLRVGRVLGAGFNLWFRRFIPIHLVAATCLAPLVLVPEARNPFDDGTVPGLYGLYWSAWLAPVGLLGRDQHGLLGNVTIAYLAQFAVTTLVACDAHRRLTGRGPRRSLGSLLGLLAYAIGSLVAFALLDLSVAAGFRDFHSMAPVLLAVIATSAVQTALAGSFWLALPAAAVDGHRILASLGRSARLARGSRIRVAVPVLLLLLLQGATTILLGFLLEDRVPWVYAAPAILFLTLKACVLASAYREICLLKEGLRPEEIGAIFA